MALGIALMVYLEGKGDDFIPEITDKMRDKVQDHFDVPEVIDDLFEGENRAECSE
jgi:hypothetical protein